VRKKIGSRPIFHSSCEMEATPLGLAQFMIKEVEDEAQLKILQLQPMQVYFQ